MTRRPAENPGPSALYEYLRETFKAQARQLVHRPGVAAHLDAMQAGAPVDVHAADLPAWARRGEPLDYHRRAIVAANGHVHYYDDVGTRWIEEHGL